MKNKILIYIKPEDLSGFGVYQDIEWPVEVESITHWLPIPKSPK